MTRPWIALTVTLVMFAPACEGEEDDGGATSVGATSSDCGDFAPCTTGQTATTNDSDAGTAASTAGSDGPTSGASATSGASGSESGTAGACHNQVPGGWNRCIDDMGDIDNKMCMWMGTGDSVGIVGCLTSSSMMDANVCFIDGCETVCDCFAPPATGTAEVVCDAILEGGGMGCGLDCSGGKTCPDGMECYDNLCFWPAMP